MPNLEMDIYTVSTGVQVTVEWPNEEGYRLGKELLTKMGAHCGPAGEVRKNREFFYLQTSSSSILYLS